MDKIKYTTMRSLLIFVLCLGGLAVFPWSVSAQYHTSTVGATNIGENSATLRGYVNAFFSNTTKRWFQWGDSPDSFSRETNHMSAFGGTEEFRENISGLSPRTTYFFRTAAQNTGEGVIFGEVKSFTTENRTAGTISVSTNSVSAVGGFSATVNCFVDPQGNADTQRWIDFGKSISTPVSTEKKYQNVAGSYSVVLSNLSQNTVYYFRCAAKTADTNPTYGNILNFTTNTNTVVAPSSSSFAGNNQNGSNFNAGANSTLFVSQVVATKLATNIIDTGATLNAVALPVGSLQTYGWFEWGSTPNLGHTSVRRHLGAGGGIPFSEALSGLTPGTTYFFKPIIENQNGTAEGVVFSFHTTGILPATTPVSGSLNTASAITSIIKKEPKPVVVVPENKERIKVEVMPNTDTASPNERISETIKIENTTNVAITEVVIRAVLPCTVEYISTGGDEFVENGKMLTHKIGTLKPNEKISILLRVMVGANVADKTPMETIAVVNWEDKIHPNDTESVGRATVTVDTNKIAKESVAAAATTKGASSVFPQNFKSWGFVIGFLFLLVAAYIVFMIIREKKEEEAFEEVGFFGEVPIRPTVSRVGVPTRNYIKDPFVSDNNLQKNTIATPVIPVKKTIVEKGAPPENLPI